jgi:hypothetical protein
MGLQVEGTVTLFFSARKPARLCLLLLAHSFCPQPTCPVYFLHMKFITQRYRGRRILFPLFGKAIRAGVAGVPANRNATSRHEH